MVNDEIRRQWEAENGYNPDFSNKRIVELTAEREQLEKSCVALAESPRLDVKMAKEYLNQMDKMKASENYAEKKKFLRAWVEKIKLAPETLEVEINYRIPEPLVNKLGAGALSAVIHNHFVRWLEERIYLSRKGRR